jgi:hypothetical protein
LLAFPFPSLAYSEGKGKQSNSLWVAYVVTPSSFCEGAKPRSKRRDKKYLYYLGINTINTINIINTINTINIINPIK